MPGFRWELENDISLCVEVCKLRPDKTQQWQEVADSLNKLFSTSAKATQLKGRGCKERLFLLLKKYKEEDVRSLKRFDYFVSHENKLLNVWCVRSCVYAHGVRSGTEEDYTELAQLLEDIQSYQKDFEEKKENEKQAAVEKRLEEKRKGEAIRKAAMQRLSSKKTKFLFLND